MDVIDSDFKVHLDEFTGPLDLLLHLVRSHEMEVRDLPLAQITAEYVEMLQFMKKMDLEVASEFLEIAATLVRFKARALLPSRSLAGDIDDLAAEEEALLEQLVEHQVTRMAAQHLRGREKRAAAVWFRGEKAPPGEVSEDVEIVEADLFSLVGAFKELLAGVDSPRLFGAIAAANALSDVYAMGAKPLFALNIVAFPVASLPTSALTEILLGAGEVADEADVPMLGGHTIEDTEPKFGWVVTGTVVGPDGGALPGATVQLAG